MKMRLILTSLRDGDKEVVQALQKLKRIERPEELRSEPDSHSWIQKRAERRA